MTCSYRLLVITAAFVLSSCRPEVPGTSTGSPLPLRGTDFSQLPKIEAEGYAFADKDGIQKDAKEIGFHYFRLSLYSNDRKPNQIAKKIHRYRWSNQG